MGHLPAVFVATKPDIIWCEPGELRVVLWVTEPGQNIIFSEL